VPRGRIFYGWVVVGVAFTTQFVSTGFFFYGFSITLKALSEEFGGGRAGVASIQGVMPLIGAAMAPFVGRLAGRGYIRRLFVLGAVSLGLGFLAVSRATQLWHLYVIFPTLVAFGVNTLSGVVPSAIVVNWFDRTRARALGFSQIGASAGGMLMAPVGMALVSSQGWRGTYLVYGLITLALVPLIAWLAVGRPEDRGLQPDGAASPPSPGPGGAPSAPPPFRTGDVLRDPNLWLIAFATGVGFMVATAVITHGAALASDAGLSEMRAATLLSVFSTGALLGKPLFGWMADRVGERPSFLVSLGIQAAGLLGLVGVQEPNLLFGVMAGLGLGVGGVLPLSAALVARVFGRLSFGPVMGLVMPLVTPLVSAGVVFAAWVFDTRQSYDLAFGTFVAALALAALALSRVGSPEPAGAAPAGDAAALRD
jgi:MFS family permease